MKIAIVHDDFMQWGGAERLVLAMAKLWPESPIFTSIYDEKVLPHDFPVDKLQPSFLQRWPLMKKFYRDFFFLYPLAFESFNFNRFDVVISSTTRFAKSIVVQPQTLHICYCNTPPKFLWMPELYFSQKRFNPILAPFYWIFLPQLLSYLRVHDQIAAQKVDFFLANSRNVARRIKKYYHRQSEVIYPFVDYVRFADTPIRTNKRRIVTKENYFLIVSRLGGHKRVDLVIEAFNKLKLPLKIIGEGPARKIYQKKASSNIEFLGHLPDGEVTKYYQNCSAFIHPQLEDFGITALEAQAAGKPVIAYQGGGALETVIDGVTGRFFHPQTPEALMKVLKEFDPGSYDATACRKQAAQFSRERFEKELVSFVEGKWKDYQESLV